MANNNGSATRGEVDSSSLQSSDTARKDGVSVVSAETQAPIVEGSWDPYQVWLTRVKQPREQSARRSRLARGVVEPSAPDPSDTARLRTLTIVR